jgi:hypothetical protein
MTSEILMDMEVAVNIEAMIGSWLMPGKSKYGYAKHVMWRCEDNYMVLYTTEAIHDSIDGKHDGKYACMVYRPLKRKNPSDWKMVYWRTFSKRKTAKQYALKHYYKHSPKRAARHGVA